MAILDLTLPGGAEWMALVLGYLLGSTAFGLILGLALRRVDIREHGSGNVGATNAGRVLGRPFAIAAFIGDFLKGWLPAAWLGPLLAQSPERAPSLAVLAGGAAVCGHCWPLYFRFRGGKAVATGTGVVIGLDPWVFLGGGVVWLLAMAATRMVSLASILMAAFAFPLFAWWRMVSQDADGTVLAGTLGLSLLVLLRHRSNIARILAGTESRVGEKRGGEPPGANADSKDS